MVRKFRPSVTVSTRFGAKTFEMLLDLAEKEHDGNVSACIRKAVYRLLKDKGYNPPLENFGSKGLEPHIEAIQA